jgi:hypothetical protein
MSDPLGCRDCNDSSERERIAVETRFLTEATFTPIAIALSVIADSDK